MRRRNNVASQFRFVIYAATKIIFRAIRMRLHCHFILADDGETQAADAQEWI